MAKSPDASRLVLSYATPAKTRPRNPWSIAAGCCILVATGTLFASLPNLVSPGAIPAAALAACLAGAGVILATVARRYARGRHLPARWIAVIQIIAALLLIISMAAMPLIRQSYLNRNRGHARTGCASNLRQIGLGCLLYAHESGGAYPDSFEALLLTQDLSPHVFYCYAANGQAAAGPTTQAMIADFRKPGRCSYVYVGQGLKDPADPNAIVAYEPLANHGGSGMNVLFGDGTVDFVGIKDAQFILSELAAGHNPPRKRAKDGQPIDPSGTQPSQ